MSNTLGFIGMPVINRKSLIASSNNETNKAVNMSEGIMYKYRDHKGNAFKTQNDMCNYWGVNVSSYIARRNKGLSIEESLTMESGRTSSKKCVDHKGNVFNSLNEMCEYWGVSVNAFNYRNRKGFSLEKCLDASEIKNKTSSKECIDHTGRKFGSIKEMCEYWGVDVSTFSDRVTKNRPLSECLSANTLENSGGAKRCSDHLGNTYDSIKEMCEAWGTEYALYMSRRHRGLSIEMSLTGYEISNFEE